MILWAFPFICYTHDLLSELESRQIVSQQRHILRIWLMSALTEALRWLISGRLKPSIISERRKLLLCVCSLCPYVHPLAIQTTSLFYLLCIRGNRSRCRGLWDYSAEWCRVCSQAWPFDWTNKIQRVASVLCWIPFPASKHFHQGCCPPSLRVWGV